LAVEDEIRQNNELRHDNELQSNKLADGQVRLAAGQSALLAKMSAQARERSQWDSAYRLAVYGLRVHPSFPQVDDSPAKYALAAALQKGWLRWFPGQVASEHDRVS
jgi:hypothetical protein